MFHVLGPLFGSETSWLPELWIHLLVFGITPWTRGRPITSSPPT